MQKNGSQNFILRNTWIHLPELPQLFTNQKSGRMRLTNNSALRNIVFSGSGQGSESHNERKQTLAKRKYTGTGISWQEIMKKKKNDKRRKGGNLAILFTGQFIQLLTYDSFPPPL